MRAAWAEPNIDTACDELRVMVSVRRFNLILNPLSKRSVSECSETWAFKVKRFALAGYEAKSWFIPLTRIATHLVVIQVFMKVTNINMEICQQSRGYS